MLSTFSSPTPSLSNLATPRTPLSKKPKNVVWEPFPGAQQRFLTCPAWECLLWGNRGGGKSQPLHSKILTPRGWITMGDVQVGHRICNPDGTTSAVIGVFPQGNLLTYKVKMTDGGITYCSEDHLWKIYEYLPKGFISSIASTSELIQMQKANLPIFIESLKNNAFRTLESITPYKIEPCQCIKVDNPNSLYITDDFIVTHNTDVLLMDYLQNVGKGLGVDYKGLLLREATTELGDVITKSKKWIYQIFPGAKFNSQKKMWEFPGGEVLWFNYARVEDDYWQYHGQEWPWCVEEHTNILMGDNTLRKAKDIRVGDYVQTLEGPKIVQAAVSSEKSCVLVSFFDDRSQLIGEQIQGEDHKLLSIFGVRDTKISKIGAYPWIDYKSFLKLANSSISSLNVLPIFTLNSFQQNAFLFKFYIHPYNNEFRPTFENFSLELPMSCSMRRLPGEKKVIDLQIKDASHYISKLFGNTYDLPKYVINKNCGWEELTNQPNPNIYLKLMSCNRSSNPNIKTKYRATCNPSGQGHAWVKERFINRGAPGVIIKDEFGQTRTHVQSFLNENKALLGADPFYKAKLYSMTKGNPMLEKAWIEGSWDLVIGGFFTDVWDPKIHILPSFKIPNSWNLVRSFDWGSSKPWSVTYGVECNGEQPARMDVPLPYFPTGTVIIVNELYGWNGTPNEGDAATAGTIAQRVKGVDNQLLIEYGIQCNAGPADIAIFDVKEGTSIAKTMSTFHCNWTKAYKGSGSRISGWALIRQMLSSAKEKDLEAPHLYFFERAHHHIRTLPIMQRDKTKPEDVDSTLEDHAMDSLRYLLARKLFAMSYRKVKN